MDTFSSGIRNGHSRLNTYSREATAGSRSWAGRIGVRPIPSLTVGYPVKQCERWRRTRFS